MILRIPKVGLRVWAVFALLASGFVVMVLWFVIQTSQDTQQIKRGDTPSQVNRDRQLKDIEALAEEVKKQGKRIADCTTPKGVCYERGQANGRKFSTGIGEYSLALTFCADAPGQQTEKELRACAKRVVSRATQSQRP